MDRDLFKRASRTEGRGKGRNVAPLSRFFLRNEGEGRGEKKERKLKLVEYENWRKLSL